MGDPNFQQVLQSAVKAIKAGNKVEGKRLLEQALHLEPRSEAAWLWMSGVVETRQERIECLQRVLAINPQNMVARRGLEQLLSAASGQSRQPAQPAAPFERSIDPLPASQPIDLFREFLSDSEPPAPAPQKTADKSAVAQKSAYPVPVAKQAKAVPRQAYKTGGMSRTQIFILVGLGTLIVVALIVAGILILPNLLNPPVEVSLDALQFTSTPEPTITLRPTSSSSQGAQLPVTNNVSSTLSANLELTGDVPLDADPRRWVLSQEDLSAEYKLIAIESGFLTNESLAALQPDPVEFLVMLSEVGRVNGYQAAYEYTSYEMRQMTSAAEILQDSAGAQRYLDALHGRVLALGWSEIVIDAIGEASRAYIRTDVDERNSKLKWVRYFVLIRQRNVLLTLLLSAPESQARQAEPLGLAEKVAGRVSSRPQTPEAIILAALPDITPDLSTPTPTLPPTPSIIEQAKKIGPVTDYFNSTYALQITINGGRYSMGRYWERPQEGNQYIILDVTFTNLGPGVAHYIGAVGFGLEDAQGVIRSPIWLSSADACYIRNVDLAPNGTLSGCIAFESPRIGSLMLIYSPIYLLQQRSITFVIRE